MCKKSFGMLLMGAMAFFCSCVDDTYDLANKELAMDMKIEGNRLALPLGSLRPIVLDSILDVTSIPVLETDSVTRAYSLSLNDSLVTRVGKEDLDVLKEVSNLSSQIDPISIPLDEISFSLPSVNRVDSMSFEEVELTDVDLDPINEEVLLELDEIKIDPIEIKGEDHPVKFEIPDVKLEPVTIPGKSELVSFEVDDVEVDDVESEPVTNEFEIGVDPINLDNITMPKFDSKMSKMVGDDNPALQAALAMGDDAAIPMALSPSFNDESVSSEGEMSVDFTYPLPEEIEHFDGVTLVGKDGKGALFEFVVTNPTLLSGLNRTINFEADFPDNYELALYDDANRQYYNLSDDNVVSVEGMPANGETTTIHFYLKKIKNLSDDRYYTVDNGVKSLAFNDPVGYHVDYAVSGNVTIAAGTTVRELKDGLSYSIELDASFNVDEAYGTTNPVEIDFEDRNLDFSFKLEELDYIKRINTIELNPTVSQLRFSISADKNFGEFDIDPKSKILLVFPDKFVFADNVTLPKEGVTRRGQTNVFEINSLKVFEGEEWVLPIREVKIEQDVTADKTLDLEVKAVVKAESSNGTSGVLTIGGKNELALKKSTKALCVDRQIVLSASAIELAVLDVTGETTPIDIEFAGETINFDFPVEGDFENIQRVDYVEFNTSMPIKITSSVDKDFGNIDFEEGSCIALRFPEGYEFDINSEGSLPYDPNLKAFVINDLGELKNGSWTIALKKVNLNKEPQGNKFEVEASVVVEAVNKKGKANCFYVENEGEFSLKEMENSFGEYNITFALEESPVEVVNLQANTNKIDVDFATESVTQPINLESLSYVTHIGSVLLEEGQNKLEFRTGLKGGGLGRFNLANNSFVDFIFPEEFRLDKTNSSIPNGAYFVDSAHIRINNLTALNDEFIWKLAVKRIAINQPVKDEKFNHEYTIKVVASSAEGEEGKLTIAPVVGLTLKEIQEAGGEREMEVSVLPSNIVIADVQASISDIDFDFKEQVFDFPVDIKDLELVKEIKYISFDKEHNKILLNISLDGTLEPFDLADNSVVKISFPTEFVLDTKASDLGGLDYRANENAIYINKIRDIKNAQLVLALDRIEINKVIENNQFKWKGIISVEAINTATGEKDKLTIAGSDNLWLTDVQDVMSDKVVKFDVPAAQLKIEEAVIVSNTVKTDIDETIEIKIDEALAEPIDRVDSIGFKQPVPMVLKITTTGLEGVDAPINLSADIVLPPVFDISTNDDKVTVTDQGLSINTSHNFKENSSIQLDMWVNSLDFTSLKEGYLALAPTEDGGRKLKYDGEASIKGTVSMDDVQLSSKLLESDVTLGISFEMGDVVLKNFTGIYSGSIDPVTESFELGIEDGFAELEKNGLKLTNTKPELMITLYNSIGVPVDVDLSIIGRDKEGNAIPSATIDPGKTLRVKPAALDAQGVLVADTTRWIFTSNENAYVPGYEVVVVKNLDSLLNNLPYAIDFALTPKIVTKDVVHHVDLSKLELGGSYSISVPFDLQFAQSIPLDLGEEVRSLTKENNLTLANPQLALSIHNPIAQDLAFDLSLIGKDANGQPISTASMIFDEPFVLEAGQRNADGTITPTPTRWLFAVGDSIKKEGFTTKVAPALGTLLKELPYNIDIALNAHFNTDLTTQIDYDNDLELMCEYGVLVPLQFTDIQLNYTDTVSEIKFNLEETLLDLNLGLSNIGLAISMNLKNTLPLGLKLDLIPLDANGNVVEGIEIGSIEVPAGDGSDIGTGENVEGTPVELTINCASASAMSSLDKISFRLDVTSGNGDNALSGAQGLQVSDIVLEIMCDVEVDLSK